MTSLFLQMKTVILKLQCKKINAKFNIALAVPGVVSDLTGQPKFTSIVLTWSAPEEPNGVIISYEVTYRVSDGNLVTTNTTDLRFTIPSLIPGTNVTKISVSAYTSVGRGDPVQIPHLVTLVAPRKYIIIIGAGTGGPGGALPPNVGAINGILTVKMDFFYPHSSHF